MSKSSAGRRPHAIYDWSPSLTVQSHKSECDINQIIKRARAGADISHVSVRAGVFGDFSKVPSYQESLNFVIQAEDLFMSLDAVVRKRFHNDPQELLEFVQDPANRDEARKLGLLKPLPESDPKAPTGPAGEPAKPAEGSNPASEPSKPDLKKV